MVLLESKSLGHKRLDEYINKRYGRLTSLLQYLEEQSFIIHNSKPELHNIDYLLGCDKLDFLVTTQWNGYKVTLIYAMLPIGIVKI